MINNHGISGMKNDPNPFRHNVLLETKWQQEKNRIFQETVFFLMVGKQTDRDAMVMGRQGRYQGLR
jgi:hypothetical protein